MRQAFVEFISPRSTGLICLRDAIGRKALSLNAAQTSRRDRDGWKDRPETSYLFPPRVRAWKSVFVTLDFVERLKNLPPDERWHVLKEKADKLHLVSNPLPANVRPLLADSVRDAQIAAFISSDMDPDQGLYLYGLLNTQRMRQAWEPLRRTIRWMLGEQRTSEIDRVSRVRDGSVLKMACLALGVLFAHDAEKTGDRELVERLRAKLHLLSEDDRERASLLLLPCETDLPRARFFSLIPAIAGNKDLAATLAVCALREGDLHAMNAIRAECPELSVLSTDRVFYQFVNSALHKQGENALTWLVEDLVRRREHIPPHQLNAVTDMFKNADYSVQLVDVDERDGRCSLCGNRLRAARAIDEHEFARVKQAVLEQIVACVAREDRDAFRWDWQSLNELILNPILEANTPFAHRNPPLIVDARAVYFDAQHARASSSARDDFCAAIVERFQPVVCIGEQRFGRQGVSDQRIHFFGITCIRRTKPTTNMSYTTLLAFLAAMRLGPHAFLLAREEFMRFYMTMSVNEHAFNVWRQQRCVHYDWHRRQIQMPPIHGVEPQVIDDDASITCHMPVDLRACSSDGLVKRMHVEWLCMQRRKKEIGR